MRQTPHVVDVDVLAARRLDLGRLWSFVSAIVALPAGCHGASDEQDPGAAPQLPAGVVARLEVSPTAVLLVGSGQSQRLRVRACDANGAEVPDPALAFVSSRAADVTVSADGAVTAVCGLGSALISVTSGSYFRPS
jgi:hypothetical protein